MNMYICHSASVTDKISSLLNVLMMHQKHFTDDWSCCFIRDECLCSHLSWWRWICLVLWRPRGSSGVLVRCVSSLAASDDSNRNSTHCTCASEIRLPWYSNVDVWESQSFYLFFSGNLHHKGRQLQHRHNASHPKQKNFIYSSWLQLPVELHTKVSLVKDYFCFWVVIGVGYVLLLPLLKSTTIPLYLRC